MSIFSLSRLLAFSFRLKNPPFTFTTKIPLTTTSSNVEKLYTHLLNPVQNPENTLNCIRVQLDAQCVSEILRRCSLNTPQLGLRFFIWAGLQSRYRHSKHMYSLACKLLEIQQNPNRILELFEAYRVEGCAINVKLFKVVLNLCKEARVADEALWVLRKMEEFNCSPDSTVFNVVIRLFCEKGDLEKSMGLMKEMEAGDLYPDMITYMSMLKGLCDADKLEDACQLFKVMRSHGCTPNIVVCSTLLDGLCRFGSPDRALEFLGEMEKEGGECTPNVITYTSVIQSFCEKGKSIEALCILDRMRSYKCSPNRVTISILIKGLCTEGHIDEAYKLVDTIIGGSHVSAGECYNSLVISLLRVKRVEDAEKLFRWMLDNAVKPNGFACSVLMKGLFKEGKFLDAFNLYEEVEKKRYVLSMDSDLSSALLVGLCQQNHKAEIAKLASLMDEKGIQIKAPHINAINEHLKGSKDMKLL